MGKEGKYREHASRLPSQPVMTNDREGPHIISDDMGAFSVR